ncbi:choloylglycine hydrolase family protein [Vibrio sp. JCM 19236]|nr:choloylglycine hydrolase family protein [Vibrio sp. JCM 19236]
MNSPKKTFLATLLSITSTATMACTGFAIEAPDGTNVFAFNSENDVPFTPQLVTIEAGTSFTSDYQNPDNALKFTTKYDIVGIGPFGDLGTAMNSQGMAGSVFNLWGTEYNEVNKEDKNALYIMDVHKYVLGNAKTIDEAEAILRKVKVGKSVWVSVKKHMQVELSPEFQVAYQDKNGDKAVFYWVDGELVITRDADGTVANTIQTDLIKMQDSLAFDHSYKDNLEG